MTVCVGLALLIDALAQASVAVMILANVAVAAGLIEFNRLVRALGAAPFAALSLAGGLFVLNWPWAFDTLAGLSAGGRLGRFYTVWGADAAVALLAVVVAVLVAHIAARQRSETAFHGAAATVVGVCYLALPLSLFMLFAWRLEAGAWSCVMWLLATAKAGDIAAWAVGRKLGRHRLAPITSPRKTLEGAGAGLAASVLVSGAFGAAVCAAPVRSALIGLIVGLTGQLGDLIESALKRSAGAKQSAAWMPAFGGALDVLDSLVFSLPAGAMAMQWMFNVTVWHRGI